MTDTRDSIFLLPPVRIGPYTVEIHPGDRSLFKNPRLRTEGMIAEGPIHVDSTWEERELIRWYVRQMVRTIHYRSGLNAKCDEEAFTHSLATGMVEIAANSPVFWVEFNDLLCRHLETTEHDWGAHAGGAKTSLRPQHVSMDKHVYRIVSVKSNAFWGWCNFTDHRIELNETLVPGTQMCVVSLHECTHLFQHALGIADLKKDRQFEKKQADGFMKFIQQNPQFWAWWLSTLAQERNTKRESE
jgi:hypothetical protein